MKFEQNWLRSFRGNEFENVNGRMHGWTMDKKHTSGELKTIFVV